MRDALRPLPGLLVDHLNLTVIALLLGMAISLPASIWAARRPAWRGPLLGVVGVIQTIPSLALLALMVPLVAAFGASGLGFAPAILALTLYSMLPLVRNTVTGLAGVDPNMLEAARGLGMSPRQMLWRVELPLAAPVILAGVRTSAVWVVGTATLATPVGQRCLGNAIFRGLQTRDWPSVVFACLAAALLALGLDALIGRLEASVARRSRRGAIASGLGLAAVVLVGLFAPALSQAQSERFSTGTQASQANAVSIPQAPDTRPIRIGAKNFTEQYILAEAMAQLVRRAGLRAEKVETLGSSVVFDALARDELDVYVDYGGTLWANQMKRSDAGPSWRVLAELDGWLAREKGIRLLGPLGFENAYALAMTRARARDLGIVTLADLAPHTPRLRFGGDYEFFGRPEWASVRDAYGLRPANLTTFDPAFLPEAASRGEADVISAFSSDGRIETFDLVVLTDPKHAIPPYDAILLLAPGASERSGLTEALGPLIKAISPETMRRLNGRVDRAEGKISVEQAARELVGTLKLSNEPTNEPPRP